MIDDTPIPFPILGESEALAAGQQPPLTARRARNVRPRSRGDDRMRGGSRPGLVRVTAQPMAGPVQRIVQVAKADAADTYADLEEKIVDRWTATLGGSDALAGVVGPQGDLFVVTSDNSLVRYNSAGERVSELPLELHSGESLTPSVGVSTTGRVFVAISSNEPGRPSRYLAYDQAGTDRWDRAWTLETQATTVRVFRSRLGYLVSVEGYEGANAGNELVRVDLVDLDTPLRVSLGSAPSEVNDMAIGSDASIYLACLEDLDRGQSPNFPLFDTPLDVRSTIDLTNGADRWWASMRATQLRGASPVANGARVAEWSDIRQLATDTTVRSASYPGPPHGSNFAPALDADGLGPRAGVVFNGQRTFDLGQHEGFLSGLNNPGIGNGDRIGEILRSRAAVDFAPKLAAGDRLDRQRGIFPRWKDPYFVTCVLLRFQAVDEAQMVLFEHGGGPQYRIFVNDDTHLATEVSTANTQAGNVRVTWEGGNGGTGGLHATGSGIALVTIIRAGTTMSWRLNGLAMTVTTATVNNGGSPGEYARTYLGGPFGTPLGASFFGSGKGWAPYSGYIAAIETVLGDTAAAPAAPHEVATTLAEIELIEAQIMAEHGSLQYLDPGHTYSPSVPPTSGTSPLALSDAAIALLDTEPLLAKFSPAGDPVWVFAGAGVGHAVEFHTPDVLINRGNRAALNAGDTSSERASVMRKVRDAGLDYDANRSAQGVWLLRAQPADGDLILVSTATPQTFEFDNNAVVAPGNVSVTIGANLATTAANLEAAIAATYPAFDFVAERVPSDDDPQQLNIFSSISPSPAVTFTVTAGSIEKVLDLTGVHTSSVAWQVTGPAISEPFDTCERLAITEDGDIFVPWKGVTHELRRYDSLGVNLWIERELDQACVPVLEGGDFPKDAGVNGPESLYILGRSVSPVRRVSLLSRTRSSTRTTRDVRTLAFAGGIIYEAARGASPKQLLDTSETTSRYIAACTLGERAFFTTGAGFYTYNARTNVAEEWKPDSGGELLEGAELLVTWRNRVVMARGSRAPSGWLALREGDPFDADTAPPGFDTARPILGAISRAGLFPEPINSIAVIGNDVLILGGDTVILALPGNPAEDGVYDLVTDATGIAFGSPVAQSRGVAFVLGSRGGVWRIGADGAHEITETHLLHKFREIDHRQWRFELEWDEEGKGLHVFRIRLAQRAETGDDYDRREHWFWSEETEGWFSVELVTPGHEPRSSAVLFGDTEQDRAVVVGGEDGHIRAFSGSTYSDDGIPFPFEVSIGPLQDSSQPYRTMLRSVTVELAKESDPAILEVGGSRLADGDIDTIRSLEISGGYNGPLHTGRASGSYLWLTLRGVSKVAGFALEAIRVRMSSGGAKRRGMPR